MSNKLEEPTYIEEIKIANIGPRHLETFANVSCEGPSRDVTQLEIEAFKYQVSDGMPGSIKEAAKTTKKQGVQKINLMNETSKFPQNDRISNVQTDNLHPFSKPQSQAGELPTINHATPPETSALSKEHVLKAQVVRTGKTILDNPTATDPRSDSVSYPFQNSAMQRQRFRNEDTENHSSTYTLLQPIHVQQPAGVYGEGRSKQTSSLPSINHTQLKPQFLMSGPSSNFDEPKNSVGIIIINANEMPQMQDRKTGISPPYRNTKQQVFSVCKKPI